MNTIKQQQYLSTVPQGQDLPAAPTGTDTRVHGLALGIIPGNHGTSSHGASSSVSTTPLSSPNSPTLNNRQNLLDSYQEAIMNQSDLVVSAEKYFTKSNNIFTEEEFTTLIDAISLGNDDQLNNFLETKPEMNDTHFNYLEEFVNKYIEHTNDIDRIEQELINKKTDQTKNAMGTYTDLIYTNTTAIQRLTALTTNLQDLEHGDDPDLTSLQNQCLSYSFTQNDTFAQNLHTYEHEKIKLIEKTKREIENLKNSPAMEQLERLRAQIIAG